MAESIASFNKKLTKMKKEFQKEFLRRVADKTPVRTGLLQASWYWDNSNKDLPVFSNKQPYAQYVEFGTEHMRPVMMVGTTIKEADDILKIAAEKAGL